VAHPVLRGPPAGRRIPVRDQCRELRILTAVRALGIEVAHRLDLEPHHIGVGARLGRLSTRRRRQVDGFAFLRRLPADGIGQRRDEQQQQGDSDPEQPAVRPDRRARSTTRSSRLRRFHRRWQRSGTWARRRQQRGRWVEAATAHPNARNHSQVGRAGRRLIEERLVLTDHGQLSCDVARGDQRQTVMSWRGSEDAVDDGVDVARHSSAHLSRTQLGGRARWAPVGGTVSRGPGHRATKQA
jgi:hypothetical protein